MRINVLGPVLFVLYMADLFSITQRRGLVGYSYADDSSIFLHLDLLCAVPSYQLSLPQAHVIGSRSALAVNVSTCAVQNSP